jgi:nucleoside-diphosphate-sugar epimerase
MGDTLRQYLQGKLPMIPTGAAYCWAHVDDVARGHILAMEKGVVGQKYIIAGECKSLIDTLALAEQITGIPAPRMHAPPAMLKFGAAIMGVVEKVAPVPDLYRAETLRVSAGVTYMGDNAKARRELGYNPRPLEVGLRETLLNEMERLNISTQRRSDAEQRKDGA